jgi:hypothetical protein
LRYKDDEALISHSYSKSSRRNGEWKIPEKLPKWTGSTKDKAHEMVRWALKYNERLIQDYDVRQVLGWGGCGCVLGTIRLSDRREVLFTSFYVTEFY